MEMQESFSDTHLEIELLDQKIYKTETLLFK